MVSPIDLGPRVSEWQHRLLMCVSGLLAFETLTGLSIYLLPFSVPNQVAVVLHTVVGLVFVVPYGWYQIRHWQVYRERQMTHIKLTGYFSMVAAIALAVSGLVLSYQALLTSRISYGWDLVHLIATFALIASVLPHVLTLVYYALRGQKEGALELRGAQGRLGLNTLYLTAALLAAALAMPASAGWCANTSRSAIRTTRRCARPRAPSSRRSTWRGARSTTAPPGNCSTRSKARSKPTLSPRGGCSR